MVSVSRRPLPATNLRFLTECPGRTAWKRSSLDHVGWAGAVAGQPGVRPQGHAQANPGVTEPAVVAQIVAFESGILDKQVFDCFDRIAPSRVTPRKV
jgi:hypothetical protein